MSTGRRVEVFSGRGLCPVRLVQKIIGNVAGDSLGVDALPLGDVNGDGWVDFVGTVGPWFLIVTWPNRENSPILNMPVV